MRQKLKQNLPVLTADEYRLGQTHVLYHSQEPARPEHDQFASYLMVVNMTIGDEYYVPTSYIDETRDDATAVWLSLSRKYANYLFNLRRLNRKKDTDFHRSCTMIYSSDFMRLKFNLTCCVIL